MPSRDQIVQSVPLVVLVTVLALQWRAGAFEAEFAGHPDESAHYVSGVMIFEYLRQGAPESPLAFAENYYLHYPKVAIGHWPPFFYGLQGGWMLAFSPARASVMMLMAILTAAVAALIYRFVLAEVGLGAAIWTTLIWVLSPATQVSSMRVMLEMPTALLCFGSALWYARYLKRPAYGSACAFGVAASIALLTSGVAVGLALLPPLAVLLSGEWQLARRGHFWAPLIIVVLLVAPWYLAIDHLGIDRAVLIRAFETPRLTAPLSRLGNAVEYFGVWLTPLALVGFSLRAMRADGFGRWAALGGMIIGGSFTYALVPESEEPRHAFYLLPALLCFAADGVAQLARRWGPWLRVRHAEAGFFLAAASILALDAIPFASKTSFGAGAVVDKLLTEASLNRGLVLVSSTGLGEGSIIAEAAMREPTPRRIFLRASKLLAESSWTGRRYRLRYETEEEINGLLESLPVAVVVLDDSQDTHQPQHHKLLGAVVKQGSWTPFAFDSSMNTGSVRLFRLQNWSTKPRGRVRLDLRDRLGKILEINGAHNP